MIYFLEYLFVRGHLGLLKDVFNFPSMEYHKQVNPCFTTYQPQLYSGARGKIEAGSEASPETGPRRDLRLDPRPEVGLEAGSKSFKDSQ